MPQPPRLISFALLACLAGLVKAQEISNWSAPPFWSPAENAVSKHGLSSQGAEGATGLPTSPVPFVGIAPCRIVDTRGNGFTGAYGPPALGGNATARVFNVPAGPCPGIPADAAAFSINIAAILPAADGFLTAFPTGGAQPNASTLNYLGDEVVANATVIGAGTSGSISVFVNVTTHVIIDINGYYAGSVVTTLNGLSGNVTLTAGSNVTITPSGQGLSISTTGGPGGLLPAGATSQTLRHNGSSWVANSALTSNGTNVALTGILSLPFPVQVNSSGAKFLHTLGPEDSQGNTFLGISAGGFSLPGNNNTGVGYFALFLAGPESANNVAVGQSALLNATGSANVGLGNRALPRLTAGNSNVALGSGALENLTAASGNISIGTNSGLNISTGSNNIYIGNAGFNNESGQIRIGNAAFQNGAVIVGIANSVVAGTNVVVNAGGRLGVAASSRRFKEAIRDVADESSGLMRLRPVTFKYKPEIDPEGRGQYGLIAEEVAEIYPVLVVQDDDGRPFTVRYDFVNSLLLNEFQRQHRSIEAQRVEIDELKARLARLETALEANPGPGEKEVPLP
jgi:hypothetical protein